MISVKKKITVLAWKSITIRKRSVFMTVLELVAPLLASLAFYYYMANISMEAMRKVPSKKVSRYPVQNVSALAIRATRFAYAPSNNFTDEIMDIVITSINKNAAEPVSVERLLTKEEVDVWLENVTLKQGSGIPTSVGIVYLKTDLEKKRFRYKIRTNFPGLVTNQLQVTRQMSSYSPLIYYDSSFLGVQSLIDKSLLKIVGVAPKAAVKTGHLPIPDEKTRHQSLGLYLTFLILGYIILLSTTITDVMDEKLTGVKEVMKVMGVSTWEIWSYWVIHTMIVQLAVIIGHTFILTILEPVCFQVSSLVVCLLFFLCTIQMIFMFFVSTCFFTNTSVATAVCGSVFTILPILGNMFFSSSIATKITDTSVIVLQLVCCIFMPFLNLLWTLGSVDSLERHGIDWEFGLLFTKGFTDIQVSVSVSIIIFVVSSLILMLVLFYVDAVFPGPHGVAKPFTFICHKGKPDARSEPEVDEVWPDSFEPVRKDVSVGIRIRRLHKQFRGSKVAAVENVNLDIYRGEVMVLLGHNGAGKTTTMSMITGMVEPTEGVILLEGNSIQQELSNCRKRLGYCPQQNVYISKLTVIDQLVFFGALKGMSFNEARRNGQNILEKLNLTEKEKTLGKKLSGGMKRKLCLAISLVGDPSVIILDEPTSGLDPQSRRSIWDIILSMRGNKYTILITTHFMEEADVLGDRIAIMSQGEVVCCGSTMFLKKLYGTGYKIHVQKKPNASSEEISDFILDYVPKSKVNIVSDTQVDFMVIDEFVYILPRLFESLEKKKDSLKITCMSVSCTTLEDVFINVAEQVHNKKPHFQPQPPPSSISGTDKSIDEKIGGFTIVFQHFDAALSKKFTLLYRRCYAFCGKIIVPLVFLAIFTFRNDLKKHEKETQKPLLINLDMYPGSTIFISSDKSRNKIHQLAKRIITEESSKIRVNDILIDKNIDFFFNNIARKSVKNYIEGTLLALSLRNKTISVRFMSTKKIHTPPIAINLVANILLRNSTYGGRIEVINHPYSSSEICGGRMFTIYATLSGLQFVILLLLGSVFTDIIETVILERTKSFKCQMFIAGLSPAVYWLSNTLFDFLIYFCVSVIILFVVMLFGPKLAMLPYEFTNLFLLIIILHGLNALSFSYLLAFLMNNPNNGAMLFSLIMYILGGMPALIVFFTSSMFQLRSFLLIVFLLGWNPFFTYSLSTLSVLIAAGNCVFCGQNHKSELETVWKFPTKDNRRGILLYLVIMLFTWIFYSVLTLLIDYGYFRKLFITLFHEKAILEPSLHDDSDVNEERQRVRTFRELDETPALRVVGLKKGYFLGPKAVKGVSFLVKRGECFSILGINGAGKTTIFKMLTGEIIPDIGDAFIYDHSVTRNTRKYTASIGYCPQTEAILEELTGKEILTIITKIRGIPGKYVKSHVSQWLEKVGISEHADKRCGTYSGGTKRKLSTAMALIGKPEVVFLDEPTTGVDPVSRRALWTVIQGCQRQGQTVVLTSHSMEECEVLCSRLTIMVAGRIKCIGSVEYLKIKYGRYYNVFIKLRDPTPQAVHRLKGDFEHSFPDYQIRDDNANKLHYRILDTSIPLSQLFSNMLRMKRSHRVFEDFAISNISLEEVFLSFND